MGHRFKTISRLISLTLAFSLAGYFFPLGVGADVQSFNATADAHLQSGSPSVNNGADVVMDLNNTRDGVVRFDLSAIPSSSAITAATLTLEATAVGSATAVKNYGTHRILTDWTESTVTWNTPGSTAGTHFSVSPTQTIAITNIGSYGWDVTGDVASFVAGSAINYGWRLIWSSNTSGTSKQVSFGAKENAVSASRPVLSLTFTPPDTTAPSAVTDLALSDPSSSAMTVSWTAPGDDAGAGTAASYDLRYATADISEGNWSAATPVTGEPAPLAAGTAQSMNVAGLAADTTYFFALKTADEVPNASAISNLPSLATTATPDTTAPSAVTDLALSGPSSSAMTVSWTSPGDDAGVGTASSYDLRYATVAITGDNWSAATPVTGEPAPLAAGTAQSMNVAGLAADTTYFFALKTADEVPNVSTLSNVVSAATLADSIPDSGGSGGGGGSSQAPRRVVFSGYAYPGGTIEILRKSLADELYVQVPSVGVKIDADGAFIINFVDLVSADYLFALRIKDKDERSTSILAFNIPLFNLLAEVKDIIAPPTIGFAQASTAKNEVMKILGYATPGNMVDLELDGKPYKQIRANQLGFWSLDVDTTYLSYGEHSVRARQITPDDKPSNFSLVRVFQLSQLRVPKADLDGNGVINISDWSIFLFRWSHQDDDLRLQDDVNGDGTVDIFDFSLFLQAMKI